ncbi:MAG: transketolase [Bdellovibrionales bacterium]|nr:transketolase [Bdellovibrionales bacterium]
MEIQKPLSKPLLLADTPAKDPQFATSVKLASGDTIKVADPRATRALVALMDMNAVMGGAASHWGGPSAFADLMSAAHGLMFAEARKAGKPWHDLFLFVNDAGHCENGLYALKANYGYDKLTIEELKHFRSVQSRLTGHGESHLFPEGVLISNGPLGSAFPQAQGLAMADAMAGRMNRVTVAAISDGGCMEGEAREALAAIPGLAAHGKMAPFVMIISDNNTKLTGRIDKESFSMAPSFAALADMGWEVLDLYEAHDLQACTTMLEAAFKSVRENPHKPIAIHARTIKGYGVKKTSESSSGGHGFPLKSPSEMKAFLTEIYNGAEVPKLFLDWAAEQEAQAAAKKGGDKPSVPEQKVQVGVSKALIKKRQEGLPVISVSADLPGSTGVADFQKAFPAATQDIGVAESNMISVAAGASKLGYIPVVDTFAQFGVTKGALPITMASLSQAPVIAVFSHVGFQDAADGASHQALSYYAMLSSIPHVKTYSLTCSDEAEALVGQTVDEFAAAVRAGQTPDSTVFFLGRENFPASYGAKEYRLSKAQVLRDSNAPKLVIAASGALLGQALKAAETLAASGVECVVINPAIINHPDVATFRSYLEKCGGRLLTVEDHQVIGGMGSLLIHALMQQGVSLKAHSLGVKGEFGQSAYNAIDLYKKHGLDADAIATAARKLL